MSYPESRTAPLGIKLLCLLQVIGIPVALLGAVALGSQSGQAGFLVFLGAGAWVAVGVFIVYGLWNLRGWGWLLAVLYFGAGALVSLLSPLLWNASLPGAAGGALLDLFFGGYVLVSANHFE